MLQFIVQYLAPALAVLAVLIWFVFQIVVIARGPILLCWRCSGRQIRNARRRGPERFLPAFIAPRRCERCATRFYSLIPVNYRLRPESRKQEETEPPAPRWKPVFSSHAPLKKVK